LHARFKEMSITFFSHPVGAREVTVVYELGALGFLLGIETEDNRNSLAPVSTFGLSVEQPDVARQMLLIVGTDMIELRRAVFKGRNGHSVARALVASLPKINQPQLISYDCALASRRRHCAIAE